MLYLYVYGNVQSLPISNNTMSNMSYCRFQNTLQDLRDCEDHLDDRLSEDEAKARKRLIELCHDIADNYDADDNLPVEEDDDEEDDE